VTRRLLLAAPALFLAGCTIVRIDYERLPGDEPSGEIRFLALRDDSPERLTDGYVLTVMKNWAIVGTYESLSTGSVGAGNLKPGTYDVSIGGRGMETQSTRIEVKPGQATIVRLLVRNARHAAAAGDIAIGAGKAVLYTVGAVLYAVVWVCSHSGRGGGGGGDDNNDSRCWSCGSSSCNGHEERRKKSESAGPVSKYRKK
jgi:hypothetical protein